MPISRKIFLLFFVIGVQIGLPLSNPTFATATENIRRDFEAVQKLNTREAYEAFLEQYPEGLYATIAREELKKLNANVAAVLVRALNYELARVGCALNAGGERWTPESQAALAQFNLHAKTNLALDSASAEVLEAVRSKKQRVCPLVCGPGERVLSGTCIVGTPPPNVISLDGSYAGEVEMVRIEGNRQILSASCIIGRRIIVYIDVEGKTVRGKNSGATFTATLGSGGVFSGSYNEPVRIPGGRIISTVRRFSGKVTFERIEGQFAGIGPAGACIGRLIASRLGPNAPPRAISGDAPR